MFWLKFQKFKATPSSNVAIDFINTIDDDRYFNDVLVLVVVDWCGNKIH